MAKQTENISTMALLSQLDERRLFLHRQLALHSKNPDYVRYLNQQLEYTNLYRITIINYINLDYIQL